MGKKKRRKVVLLLGRSRAHPAAALNSFSRSSLRSRMEGGKEEGRKDLGSGGVKILAQLFSNSLPRVGEEGGEEKKRKGGGGGETVILR